MMLKSKSEDKDEKDDLVKHQGKKKKKRKKISQIIPIIGIIIGIGIMAYYPLMDLYYSHLHNAEADHVSQAVNKLSKEEQRKYLNQAKDYNHNLAISSHIIGGIQKPGVWKYSHQLDIQHDSKLPFATIQIPKIALNMPIYHGTSDAVLAAGVGHWKGSSLPIGGKNTNSVLTAHSGMNGMRAFDDIRDLKNGDKIVLTVLNKKLAYQVYGYTVVLPEQALKYTKIQKNKDMITLITCTPYGVNDHRLLVFAKRCKYTPAISKQKPSLWDLLKSIRYWPLLVALLLVFILVITGIRRRKKKLKKK